MSETRLTSDPAITLLKQKYSLHNSPEVENAARRYESRTGERISQNPSARIENYFDRFREITNLKDPLERERGINDIKHVLYRNHVIKPKEIPESYWDLQRRIIRERGQGADLERVNFEELIRQNTEAIIADQKSSLDTWIDYLASDDAPYSESLKYWTLRSVLSMGEYDKEKKAFSKRGKGTVKPFPDLNREALAYTIDLINKKVTGQPIDLSNIDPKDVESFKQAVRDGNFPYLYAWAIEKVTPADAEGLANTQGQWMKYDRGSDHMPLVESLQGHGTGWCTAGESTAQTQLQGGDFYVYYSNDREGKPTVPRVAIRMEGENIAEVRGVASDQNVDPYIAPVIEKKMEEFPDGKAYQKKAADMKKLTEIDNKIQKGELLDAVDLAFLYEIDSPIQGFGYNSHRDPRIEEILERCDMLQDYATIADFFPEHPWVVKNRTAYQDQKQITAIEQKVSEGQSLDGPDLEFLYEVDDTIQTLSNDPETIDLQNQGLYYDRVRILLSKRNTEEDIPIIFGCDSSQIAHNPSEIRTGTKAYVGPLFPGIFDRLQEFHVEHVYTSFPEGQIRRQEIEIGGKTLKQLQSKLEQAGIKVSSEAKEMMEDSDFAIIPETQEVNIVRLKVESLGLFMNMTTDRVYARAQELGLELCPAEVGPYMLLDDKNLLKVGEYSFIGMKQIDYEDDDYPYERLPQIFVSRHQEEGLELSCVRALPDERWYGSREFVFVLPQEKEQKNAKIN